MDDRGSVPAVPDSSMNILFMGFSHKKQTAGNTVNLYYSIAVALRASGHNIGLLLVKTCDKPQGYDAELFNLGCYITADDSLGADCRALTHSAPVQEPVALEVLKRRLNIDIQHVCTLGVERYGRLLRALSGPACIDCHDCAARHRYREVKHDLIRRKARLPKALFKLLYDLYRECSILRLSRHERVFTLVSEGDAKWFHALSPATRSYWIQPLVTPSGCRDAERRGVEPCSLAIWGDAGVWNTTALERLVTRILPLLQKGYPSSRIKVYGEISEMEKHKYPARPDVVFEGYVEDIRARVRTCEISCFPFSYGSGIKTKILECMNWGVPCVTSSIGGEGFRENQKSGFECGRSDAEIAGLCAALFRDPEKQTALIRAGYRVIQEEFSISPAVDSYLEAYGVALGKKGRPSHSL